MMWACVPVQAGDPAIEYGFTEYVCLMGRLDAIIVEQDHVWHLQHKSREKETDLGTFVDKLAFGGHECGYGWILHNTLQRGLWHKTLPYGGSKVAVWLKQERPSTERASLPKGLMKALEAGQVLIEAIPSQSSYPMEVLQRAHCTEKQWKAAFSLWNNYKDREAKRLEALRSYDDRVFQILDVDLDLKKMQLGFERLIYSAILKAPVDAQGEPDPMLPTNTNACERWNRMCPHLESKTCGGWDRKDVFDPDSGYTHREPDYVDEFRREYLDLWEAQ
jgi:hypothetical protein